MNRRYAVAGIAFLILLIAAGMLESGAELIPCVAIEVLSVVIMGLCVND